MSIIFQWKHGHLLDQIQYATITAHSNQNEYQAYFGVGSIRFTIEFNFYHDDKFVKQATDFEIVVYIQISVNQTATKVDLLCVEDQ